MAIARYAVDTSALARMKDDIVAERLEPLLERGLVATCAMLNPEALYSAESPTDYLKITEWRNAIMEYVDTEEAHLERAQQVQAELAVSSKAPSGQAPGPDHRGDRELKTGRLTGTCRTTRQLKGTASTGSDLRNPVGADGFEPPTARV